ncbi:WXG100 family type VII secretion target [Saccharopolyspora sp. 5N708]|uniref:WXG100 family type VII secretion target n=1 Tax=Saccharopolyspora sp. 5N708 TaxID=3457424 RepID=UPI003FCF8370
MADEINYQYQILQQGVASMRAATQQIQGQVDQLRADTQRALQDWDAASAETYGVLSGQISTDFEGINQMLTNVMQAVDSGQEDMRNTDRTMAANFQG